MGLYRTDADEGALFNQLSELTGGKYPLLAYLYFLKDLDRFMPIHPTGFDRAFRLLGIDFSTVRQCNWANYKTYNQTLGQPSDILLGQQQVSITSVSLTHIPFAGSFSTLVDQEAQRRTGEVGGW